MGLRVNLTVCASIIGLSACTTATLPDGPNTHANHSFRATADGFEISTTYSRYQFIPETDALVDACKSALLTGAYDHAAAQGRRLEPINEQLIRLSFGRNGVTGITSCAAGVAAQYAK